MNVTTFTTIQAAVNAAGSGWSIFVGPGTFSEVVAITSKTNLTITTECGAVVSGFRLSQSDTITIENFDVNATGSGSPGIALLGGNNSNQNITIRNNEVHGSNQTGIQVARDNVNVRNFCELYSRQPGERHRLHRRHRRPELRRRQSH
jgi:pectin methylesterase-like acyl-CoA thioesterase